MQWSNLKIFWEDPLVFKVLLVSIGFCVGYLLGIIVGTIKTIEEIEK